ncbi:tRNA (cytidine(34)-2'-O)-methyltransferase [Rhodospira trueperi]|uniref:tRNA (cytidine(34)-2'-O)-methyltransferase n=1 Tax=Rhodospira trueperi TaxID=69960 RepID=A0A1G7G1D8_9PROT|nr:TrmH family RNA methyltransferase [Rhodospira trueperi]SDE81899.1 tRNA (cytidine/uridine-2'-O-)-methyltransferase [Rhodospira trueperi]
MRLALYQPDMPQNTAALMRLAAGLDLPVDIIEPCGFLWDDRRLRRVGMDYLKLVSVQRHQNWDCFRRSADVIGTRVVLLTTRGATPHIALPFRPDDVLLVGREGSGVPDSVHDAVDARVTLPMAPGFRSFNVVTAAAMVASEALRQTNGWPA